MKRPVPASQRAGTGLSDNPALLYRLRYDDQRRGPTEHGTLDVAKRMYQTGGPVSDFHYRRQDLYTMPLGIWTQLRDQWSAYIDYIEFCDHEANRAYAAAWSDCVERGMQYSAGIGPRWGIPRDCFVEIDERI